jgi:hypothetical protein
MGHSYEGIVVAAIEVFRNIGMKEFVAKEVIYMNYDCDIRMAVAGSLYRKCLNHPCYIQVDHRAHSCPSI